MEKCKCCNWKVQKYTTIINSKGWILTVCNKCLKGEKRIYTGYDYETGETVETVIEQNFSILK